MVDDKELAAIIASEIFRVGAIGTRGKCERIEFKIGRNPERAGGGFGEAPLADFIETVLKKHRSY